MIRKNAFLLFFCLLFLFIQAHAQTLSGEFKFTGQPTDLLKLDQKVTVKRPVPKEVPSTCTRKKERQVPGTCYERKSRQVPGTCTREVPSQVYRCHNVTRYRQECSWIPSSQNCWTENDRQCRTETRYQKECTEGPSRQVCHQRPDRQECSQGPSQTVCQDRPSREVCSERTGQRVCSTIPGGRDCKTVPGERQCRTVSGGQECRTERGEPICRQVPYQENICHNVPRQRCETIPGRNDCRDIPYTEQECGYETEYETESYSCMKTEYYDVPYSCMKTETYDEEYACMKTEIFMVPFDKTLALDLNVAVKANNQAGEFVLKLNSTPKTPEIKDLDLKVKLVQDPKFLVVQKLSEVKIVSEDEKTIRAQGKIELELVEVKTDTVEFPRSIRTAYIEERAKLLNIGFRGDRPEKGMIEFTITRKNQVIAQVKANYPSAKVKLARVDRYDGLQVDLSAELRERLRSGMKMDLKLSVPMAKIEGEILNAKKPGSSKDYGKIRVDID